MFCAYTKKWIVDLEKFDYMKTIKNNINNVLKDKAVLPIINDLVIRTNKIVIHSCNFIKLYYIYLYENDLCVYAHSVG